MSLTLTPEVISTLQGLSLDAITSRYLSGTSISPRCCRLLTRMDQAAGLVILLYDHLLTLPDEILLIWRSPPSFSKYAFLSNRYIVPMGLIAVAFEMSGLSGLKFTTDVRRYHFNINIILTSYRTRGML